MKKFNLDKEGNITYDEKEITKKEIDGNFLNLLFAEGLKGEIEFIIDETDPIAKLFSKIEEESHFESDFAKQIQSLRSSYKQLQTEKETINSAKDEKEFPF